MHRGCRGNVTERVSQVIFVHCSGWDLRAESCGRDGGGGEVAAATMFMTAVRAVVSMATGGLRVEGRALLRKATSPTSLATMRSKIVREDGTCRARARAGWWRRRGGGAGTGDTGLRGLDVRSDKAARALGNSNRSLGVPILPHLPQTWLGQE